VSPEGPAITVTAERKDAFQFVRALAQDDDLRARVEADPRGALREVGIDVPEGLLPDRARLASKSQMDVLLHKLGHDPDDPFGAPEGEAWLGHLLCFVYMWGALPFVQREPRRDAAA
jgi:hypothetical protein